MRRPCLVQGCPNYAEGRPRCPEHDKAQTRARERRHATRRASAPGDGARRRMRERINRAGGAVCSSCGRWFPAHAIEVDHTVPLARGGHDVDANVRPLCLPDHRGKSRQEARLWPHMTSPSPPRTS